jgi:D-alanyl-lipoteichoic acid acyltransferase DltB (MBOAT superfamily)
MEELPNEANRTQIAVRLLFTLLYLIVFEILKTIIQVAVLFQYVYLLITKKHNEPVRNFSNKVTTYAYKVLRYLTLNENLKPFPFSEFPKEMDSPESEIQYK